SLVAGTELDGSSSALEPRYISRIDEVKIVASRYELFDQHASSEQFLTGEEIQLLPHIADDVFRAFHRLPGAAATDFSAPFHLRGGDLEEVKVVLDGLELFEPYHMRTVFSPLSIIDPGIIDNVGVLSGGLTAQYGNHMSGVVDISSAWSSEEPVFETGMSFVNAFFRGAGSWSDRGAYQFSLRRGYLDLVADAAAVGDEKISPRYSDVFMKAGYTLSDSTSIDAHVLFASDDVEYANTDEGEQGHSRNSLKYTWLKLDSEPNESVRWINILSTGRTSNRDQGSSRNLPFERIDRFYDRNVKVSGLQSDLSWQASDSHLWVLGLQYRHLEASFDHQIDSVRQSEFFNGGLPFEIYRNTLASSSGEELGVYLRYRFQPTLRSTWEAGLRWDKQTYTNTRDDTQLSPRVNVLFELNEQTSLRFGWGDFYQPQGIQDLQVEDGVTHYFPAAKAQHLVAGIRRRLDAGLDLQMDIYQKRYSDLRPRFENALDMFDYAAESDFDRVRVEPMSAKSEGVEITLRDRGRDHFDWWLNYTWSRAVDVIGGVEVRRSWDQRHALTGNLSWHGEKWVLNLVGRYHSGWPLTPLLVTPVLDADGALVGLNGDLSQRNQTNYEDYFRVDVRLSRTVGLDSGSFQFYLEIFNLFDTENQCCVAGHNLTVQPTVSVSPNFDAYMPFFPSFGFVWTFGRGAG
ncbi:MAG: TonB-dependent receptor, partial [Xanthomonadales bacterium]|nr:TonB-dependent receptor [Xanthomonadales bacterium]